MENVIFILDNSYAVVPKEVEQSQAIELGPDNQWKQENEHKGEIQKNFEQLFFKTKCDYFSSQNEIANHCRCNGLCCI